MTQPSGYGFYFKYCAETCGGVPRNRLIAALWAEGVLCYGDFYSPVYKDPLFAWRDAAVPVDYRQVSCPVAERAAYEEGVWLPHQLFLGTRADMDDIATAVEKVTAAWRKGEARAATS